MIYEVYIYDTKRGFPMTADGKPLIASSDAGLVDTIAMLHMDEDRRITYKTPHFAGVEVSVKIYPKFKRGDLVMNKKTFQIRRVHSSQDSHLYLCNTDSKEKAELQENGYILSKYVRVLKDDWIPIDETGGFNIYYPCSSIGNDHDFGEMEYGGIMSL